jgi:hypothetical protein
MSLEQVSAATNLRRTVLAAMEDDDFRQCGGDFYVKAHVREIARVLGVAPEPSSRCTPSSSRRPRAWTARASSRPRERIERGARRGPNWSAAMAVALVLVLGLRRVPRRDAPGPPHGRHRRLSGNPSRSAKPRRRTPGRSPQRRPARRPSDAVAQVPRAGVDVRLYRRWPELGQRHQRRGEAAVPRPRPARQDPDLHGQDPRPHDDRQRRAVTLVVNGRSLGAPGKAGTVARVDFGPRDPAAG